MLYAILSQFEQKDFQKKEALASGVYFQKLNILRYILFKNVSFKFFAMNDVGYLIISLNMSLENDHLKNIKFKIYIWMVTN